MKFILITIIVLFSLSLNSQDNSDSKISTYYFIRHAEKDRSDNTNSNPHLNEKGKHRAEKWNEVFSNIKLDAIYSTNFFRTKETALPIAIKNSQELTIYNPRELNINAFLKNTYGKKILIVGHSNSTPTFVNSILGNKKYDMIDDNNNANLYIVTIADSVIADQLLVIE